MSFNKKNIFSICLIIRYWFISERFFFNCKNPCGIPLTSRICFNQEPVLKYSKIKDIAKRTEKK